MADSTTEDLSVLSRVARAPDVSLQYGPGENQIIDLYRPASGAGALLVLIHGGYWRPQYDRVHLRPMAQALAEAGWTVAVPEYARVPGDPDQMLADVVEAVERAPGLSGISGPLIVAGHSAGGHLALCLAARPDAVRLAGVLALAPVADLLRADALNVDNGAVRDFLGEAALGRADLDPCRMLAPATLVTVMHGDADTFAPQELSRSYVAAHPNARPVWLPGSGHFGVVDPQSGVWPQVLAELRRLASSKS